MIASCSKPTTSWTTYAEQKSAVFSLKRGRRYYIESLHVQDAGKSHVSIGVKLQKTRFVNSQIGAAVNEKQEIRMSSVKHPEIQVSKILCSLCARAERPKPRKLVLVSGVESIHELDIHLPPLIPERKNVSPLNSYPVRIMAPVLNYTPGIVKKSFVSNGLPEDRTQSMLNLVYARCESGGVDVWTNISSPPSFTYRDDRKNPAPRTISRPYPERMAKCISCRCCR